MRLPPARWIGRLFLPIGLLVALGIYMSHGKSIPDAAGLKNYVAARPAYPIVFTSRSHDSAHEPRANDESGFTRPGSISWTANEGRLRLLDTYGKVFELTWGRALPDGGTLIDVMSPSVSLDGERILFAGRKAAPDAGRWRIYQVGVDGSGLRALTGGPNDSGCIALPPMRSNADGSRIPDDERRRIDYDDLDPIDLGSGHFAFTSSRIPDLGREHSRRSTQIWIWPANSVAPHPISANRNNDRWPYLLPSGNIVYSLWSRTREAVSADRTELRPVSAGGSFATAPLDRWMGARISTNAATFTYAIKTDEPVWRARPLFNGRMAFMTIDPSRPGLLRLAQADWGAIGTAASSQASGESFIYAGGTRITYGPDLNSQSQAMAACCPTPCPGGRVLFSGCPNGNPSTSFGLYSVDDDWKSSTPSPQLLFDDPDLVDSEPVAVYVRDIESEMPLSESPLATTSRPSTLRLVGDRPYSGPVGYLENLAVMDAIRSPIPWQSEEFSPGVRRDPRRNPLIPPPANVVSVLVYADHRDRFDDPVIPRIPGAWEKQIEVPVTTLGALQGWVPANPLVPSKLVGLDETGKIAKMKGTVLGSDGRPGTYYAVAGDHSSAFRSNGYHYCNGCHTGHTHTSLDVREKVKK